MSIDYIVEFAATLHEIALKINEKEKLGYRVIDMWQQDKYYVKMGKGLIIFNVGPFSTKN